MTLPLVCLHLFAEAPVSVCVTYTEWLQYLIIVQDEAETSNNGFERRKGVCRFLRPTEEQFGCGRCSGPPPLEFFPIHRT